MLKNIFSKTLGSAETKEASPVGPSLTRVELDRIKTLIEFFPIGKKLRYYPEFKEEIVFDTLIVAYCVNGNYVYSGEAIERDSEGYPIAFRSEDNDVRTLVSRLKTFQLLVPNTSDLEMKLDYQRRALIGRGRQFNKGNYISLISNAGVKGVSTVDTEVAKQIVLPEGPYSHTNMVLLTPELHSLSVTDQRKKSRAKLSAPVTVTLPEEEFSGPCTIVDISEGAVRIRVRDGGTSLPPMLRGKEVFLEIVLGEAERRYVIKGSVIRRSPETCVIQLEGQYRNGQYSSFSPLDLLELKAGLLNHG